MKSKHVLALLLATTLTLGILAGCNTKESTASSNTDRFVKQLSEKVAANWPSMERAWPGLDYTQHNLVVFHLNDKMEPKKAWLVNTKESRELTPTEYNGIEAPMPGGYNELEFMGKPSVVISFDDQMAEATGKKNEVYTLATHELVHFYHQSAIKVTSGEDGSRAEKYPITYEPRLYRTMIFQNLCVAIQESKKSAAEDSVQKAAYWYNKWKAEYGEEATRIRETDIAEGHARYIEYWGESAGKQNNEQDIRSNLNPDTLFSSADAESYELGFAAGLMLDRLQPGWKDNFFKTGKSPIELLFDQVPQKAESANPEVEKKVKTYLDSKNEEIKESIQNIISADEDQKIPYLKVNRKYGIGSMELDGFYQYKNTDIAANLTFTIQKGANKLAIKNLSVLTEASAAGETLIIPLTESFKKEGNTLIFNGTHLNGKIEATSVVDATGRECYIAE